jgi:hypothetical protein
MPKRNNPEENLQAFNIRLRPDQITALKQIVAGKRSQLIRRAIDVILFAPDLAETIESQIQREIDVRKSLGVLGHGLISPTAMTPSLSVSARGSGGLSPGHSVMIAAGAAAQPALASSRNSTQEAEKESKKFSCSPEN